MIRRVATEKLDYLDAPPLLVGAKDVPMPFNAELEDYAALSVDDITEALTRVSEGIR